MRSPNDQDGMHRRVSWMTPADVAILEFLNAARDARGNPSIQTPNTIAENTHYSSNHVGSRCRTLADYDLVEKVDRGKYRLDDRGVSLLDGGISPSSLEEKTED